MANFTGFSTRDQRTVQSDVQLASHTAMRCHNSLLLSLHADSVVQELLEEAFGIFRGDPQRRQKMDRVKDVFIWTRSRLQLPTFNFTRRPGTTPTNVLGHAAEAQTNPFIPDTIFFKDEYFLITSQPERAATIIHECIHLRFPNNPGDGHPGGRVLSFARAPLNLQFNDAVRNAYAYQYFAEFLP